MIFSNLGLFFDNPSAFFLLLGTMVLGLLVAITVHEFSHALIARSLGDITAQRLGRLSLNPVRHLDPTGTVLLAVAGFGWGKPVPVDARALRGNPRTGMALVSLAGPASNFVTAFALGALFKLQVLTVTGALFAPSLDNPMALLASVAFFAVSFNVVLGIFNLLPVFPLDGQKVLAGVLPAGIAVRMDRFQAIGPMILLGVIFADIFFRLGILSAVLGPPISYVLGLAVGLG